MRKFIRGRRASTLLAVCIAYALAIEAVMASVGLGMSADAAPSPTTFFLCSFAAAPAAHAPAGSGDPQNHTPQPQCPFCLVAAQSAGHVATPGEPPAFRLYVRGQVTSELSDSYGDKVVLPPPRRAVGNPRAPPALSV
jgi:hypothetical protein